MSDTESKNVTMTQREFVMAQRAAWRSGVDFGTGLKRPHEYPDHPCAACDRKAAELFPLPKVTRPRVVADPHSLQMFWRVGVMGNGTNGLQSARSADASEWVVCGNYGLAITPERIKLWADLLENPSETVEAE